ncbi:MAG: YggU family protein [Candidatus Thorarchaeota archaeon]|nr:MAG: YggU family protein [Candidatus Thorarchaeota archaeon]
MDAGPVWMSEKGTFLRVIVNPNSKKSELVAEKNLDSISINLVSPAKEGKANTELVKRLSKLLKISTSSIKLVTGHKSREKILLIHGLSAEEVEQKLSQ